MSLKSFHAHAFVTLSFRRKQVFNTAAISGQILRYLLNRRFRLGRGAIFTHSNLTKVDLEKVLRASGLTDLVLNCSFGSSVSKSLKKLAARCLQLLKKKKS